MARCRVWAALLTGALGCGGQDGGLPGASGSGTSGAGGSGSANVGAGAGSSSTGPGPEPTGLDALDDVRLHVNLGDSLAAGHNASGLNGEDGKGYARLLHHNHVSYPDWSASNLVARYPGAAFVDRAESGATSHDVVGQAASLPDAPGGDVVVTIYVGGNDFNDEAATMLLASETQKAIDAWRTNMTEVMATLRARYERTDQGHLLLVTIGTIHEPTDGQLGIPPGYDNGFCSMLQQLSGLGQGTKDDVWANYLAFNTAIRAFAGERGAWLLASDELFVGHGLNSPAGEQWIDDDCAHLTDSGHFHLREAAWQLIE